ncbi:hypothetical protein [Amycolatopsis sp. NPDC051372]|uniref:hypothetical protein n=1 Tax=Amycolatopsis sp. NPDC051372 TaxID=3155669 RepID=UPI00341CAD26
MRKVNGSTALNAADESALPGTLEKLFSVLLDWSRAPGPKPVRAVMHFPSAKLITAFT